MSWFANFFANNFIYPLIVPGILSGIVAIIVSFFLPAVLITYKTLFRVVGIFLILFFTFYGGKFSNEKEWKMKMAELQIEIATLEGKSKEVTVEVVTKYVDRIKEVEVVKKEYVYVDKIITPEVDTKFPLPNSFIRLYNNSLEGKVPNTTGSTNATSPTAAASAPGSTN